MDTEEKEIKIEYNENYESDPLREDVFDESSSQALVDLHVFRNTYYDVFSDKLHINKPEKVKGTRTNLNTQYDHITWFKSKDSDGKLLCKHCELKYSTVQTLRHHVKVKHPEEAKEIKALILNNKRKRKHICHVCKKGFKDLFELKSHVDLNHSMELVKSSCINCNATFNNSADMQEHIYTKHQKVNKCIYTCSICGYRTIKKSHFKQHQNTHMQTSTMFCPHCDYNTNYLPNFRIHERIHTNEKRYLCDFKDCNYQSVAKSALTSHQLKHYPKENMLFCDKCNYKTVYKQSLIKHLDSHKRNFVKKKII